MAKHRRYSDDFIVRALAALGSNKGNVNRTARQLSIPESTLRSWSGDGRRINEDIAKGCEQKKQDLATLFDTLAHDALGAIDEAGLKKQTPYQNAMTAAVATDKARLLRDEPTDISEHRGVTIEVINTPQNGQLVPQDNGAT